MAHGQNMQWEGTTEQTFKDSETQKHINNTDEGWTNCDEESFFTRQRLSSQDWLICMAA